MKILLVHNHYVYAGGEDRVFINEKNLLEKKSHDVQLFTVSNDIVSGLNKFELTVKTFWNNEAYTSLRSLIRRVSPDVVHFHNVFPLISPSGYYAASLENIPVVQTLHNYRLLCLNALFLKGDKVCEACKKHRTYFPGVLYSCYRKSRITSLITASMLTAHQLFHTWNSKIDRFIVLNQFAKNKFLESGLTEKKIIVKPNFIEYDPGVGGGKGEYALFVGRISPEKGIATLLNTWKSLPQKYSLVIVGNGPDAKTVKLASEQNSNIHFLGEKTNHEVIELIKGASFLILPSICYENMPMTVLEAYACGTPVIASNLGGLPELIKDGKTGLLFNAGVSGDLAKKVDWAFTHPDQMIEMRLAARSEYEEKYSSTKNYEQLMNVYQQAISEKQGNPL